MEKSFALPQKNRGRRFYICLMLHKELKYKYFCWLDSTADIPSKSEHEFAIPINAKLSSRRVKLERDVRVIRLWIFVQNLVLVFCMLLVWCLK